MDRRRVCAGVGFGAVMVKAKTVTDSMFLAAARAVADAVPPELLAKGRIYPIINDLRRISALVHPLAPPPSRFHVV